MVVVVLIIKALLAVALLWKCADWFVDGAVELSKLLRLPQMLVGLVIVSLATTAPELSTSLMGAMRGSPEVALGNAIGSVIIDDTIALGLGAVLAPLPLVPDIRLLHKSGGFLILVSFLLLLMVRDGELARLEGATLVMLFVFYTFLMFYTESRRRKKEPSPFEIDGLQEPPAPFARIALLFGGGLGGVLIGAHFLLDSALGMGHLLGVPEYAMGLTVVAVGTSIPEIATVAASAYKGKGDIGIGNILGADILNICWVAGLSATVNPLVAEGRFLIISVVSMILIVVSVLIMLKTGHKLTRTEGAVLLVFYVIYITVVFCTLPQAEVAEAIPLVP